MAEAAVIGTPHPRTGEAVVAYVTQRPGTSYDAAEIADEVREHCAVRLARFKQPSEVRWWTSCRTRVTGKVAKGRLRAATPR